MKNKDEYLRRIDLLLEDIEIAETRYKEERDRIKNKISQTIEEGKQEVDLSITDVAKHRGITRQAVHKIILHTYGVRHEDKSAIAKFGHQKMPD